MVVDKKNIFLSNTVEPLPYSSRPSYFDANIPMRASRSGHGNFLKRKFAEVYKQNQTLNQKQVAAIKYKEGIYLEFSGQVNHDLVVKSLDNIREGIRLLNVHTDEETKVVKATVYIPEGKESYFINRIDEYLTTETKAGNPRHKDLIESIENVALAFLDAFWFGNKTDIPGNTPIWCEIWLRANNNTFCEVESSFISICNELSIEYNDKSIHFPERIVKLIRANSVQLQELIRKYAFIAEIRRAPEITGFFDELSPTEQRELVKDLMARLKYNFSNSSICILDTGVNTGHPLLEPAFMDNSTHAVESAWGEGDHFGHGTEMAGIALFYDLKEKVLSNENYTLTHYLESVKILPPGGENKPELYGSITKQAIYLSEIMHPEYIRTSCMAVTSNKYNTNDGSPTSWSGAVDSLAFDADNDGSKKRLLLISAGNIYPDELIDNNYPDCNRLHSVESPGQAWNAITVGAYSRDIRIEDDLYHDYQAVADYGELSPYSSTSLTWDRKWPIKPEILCDGGNMATDGTNATECADLSLLTTSAKPLNRLFSVIHGTSSATAQAAWMAAQITTEYPDIWPETVRALLVHSARWTKQMKAQFCFDEKKSSGRRNLLRMCGYGIPDLDRAIQCRNNSVNLIIEGELQPFNKDGMNEMHIHDIPWPKEVLQDLGEIPVEMRVTLSYFIEPGPGEIGWKDKYRYPSCGLRFDVKNQNQTKEDFIKWVNMKMREDKDDSGEGSSGSEYWYLGPGNRDVGSIHSDLREQNAVDLCEANHVAVYPVIGWWRERKHLKCFNKKIRYSLIVSISTPETEVDLYTPVITKIQLAQKIPIEIII